MDKKQGNLYLWFEVLMKWISIQKIATILGLESGSDSPVEGYASDSRKVVEGGLFFALVGERCDGHYFLGEISEKGALGAVVSHEYSGDDFGLVLLRVESVEDALAKLAKEFMLQKKVQVIGVTGTVGKTTTKDFITTLLDGKYKVGKSPGNFNTEIGLPLSILNLSGEEEVLVLEMGMNHPGEIAKLVDIAPPDLAVITKVSLVHSMFFEDGLEGIAKAKVEILKSEKTKTAIIDHDLFAYDCIKNWKGKKYGFSIEKPEADYFLSNTEREFFIDEEGVRSIAFDLPFKEKHFLHNFLAAAACARMMKLSFEEIVDRIPKLEIPKMRFQKWESGGVTFINDAYNASPEAMKAALGNLPKPREGGKRIAILGSMKELGKFTDSAHREVGEYALSFVDWLLCLGEECESMRKVFEEAKKPAELFTDRESLTEKLKEWMKEGDVILVKGSRSLEMEKILDIVC